jgi:hypothetical protein
MHAAPARIARSVALAALFGAAPAAGGCGSDCENSIEVTIARESTGTDRTLRSILALRGYSGKEARVVAVGDAGTIRVRDPDGAWSPRASGVTSALYAIASDDDVGPPPAVPMVTVGAGGVILYSEDSGENWEQVESGTEADLYAVEVRLLAGVAVAAGDGVLLRSDDSGRTWGLAETPQAPGVLRAVAYDRMYEARWIAVGDAGAVLYSVDDGERWEALDAGTSVDLRVAGDADSKFWIAGGDEVLRMLDDAGEVWAREHSSAAYVDQGAGSFWVLDSASRLRETIAQGATVYDLSGEAPGELLAVDGPSVENGDVFVAGEHGAVVHVLIDNNYCPLAGPFY